ncbi:MAG: divergent PAP2 family protein [Traorella sp.]
MLHAFFPLWISLLSNILAQISKPFIYYYRIGHFDISYTIACGGFPSSHTSTVTALATAIGITEGFDSTYFAITCIFGFIVIYDAVNVRYYAGKNIQLTQQLISDLNEMLKLPMDDPIYHEKMKDVLGHRFIEAFGGFVLGILTAFVGALCLGYL